MYDIMVMYVQRNVLTLGRTGRDGPGRTCGHAAYVSCGATAHRAAGREHGLFRWQPHPTARPRSSGAVKKAHTWAAAFELLRMEASKAERGPTRCMASARCARAGRRGEQPVAGRCKVRQNQPSAGKNMDALRSSERPALRSEPARVASATIIQGVQRARRPRVRPRTSHSPRPKSSARTKRTRALRPAADAALRSIRTRGPRQDCCRACTRRSTGRRRRGGPAAGRAGGRGGRGARAGWGAGVEAGWRRSPMGTRATSSSGETPSWLSASTARRAPCAARGRARIRRDDGRRRPVVAAWGA